MIRREFLKKTSFGAAAVAGLHNLSCAPDTEPPESVVPPNIVLIVADDTGWNDVGYHNPAINTPNIDRLAREGVELDSFYAYPTCSPTRAALLTGRPPSRFGILGPIAMRSTLALPKDTPTLAEHLSRRDYDTAITGKWHLGLRPEVGPNEYGFTYSYGYLHGQIDQYTHEYKNGDRSWHRNGEFIDEEGHATDLITGEAERFITERRNRSKPFFLYIPYSVPHFPLQEEGKYVAPYRDGIDNDSRRLFAASMSHMDEAVGRILSTLEREGLSGSTLVVFMSDNGGQESWTPTFEYDMKFTPNDRLGDNRPLHGWKGDLYEGGIRVPALMYWPGQISPRKTAEPVIAWDIFPTLAHVAGADVSADQTIEGANVWDVIQGGDGTGERIFYWRTGQQLAIRKGDWKLVHNGAVPGEGTDELYNIADDPYETTNAAEQLSDIVLDLRKKLERAFSLDAVIEE